MFTVISPKPKADGKESGMKEIISATLKEKIVVFNELELVVSKIVHETIEAQPRDRVSYPSGYALTVFINVSCDGKNMEFELSEVSPPYDSHTSVDWCHYRISLLNISERGIPQVDLCIEKIK